MDEELAQELGKMMFKWMRVDDKPIQLHFGNGRVLLGSGVKATKDGEKLPPNIAFQTVEEEYPIGDLVKPVKPNKVADIDVLMFFNNIESLNVVIGALERLRNEFPVAEPTSS